MPANVSTMKNASKMHPDLHCGRHRGISRFSVALDLVWTRRIYCAACCDFVGVCNEIVEICGDSSVVSLDETGGGECDCQLGKDRNVERVRIIRALDYASAYTSCAKMRPESVTVKQCHYSYGRGRKSPATNQGCPPEARAHARRGSEKM